jgi:hypothetical protein
MPTIANSLRSQTEATFRWHELRFHDVQHNLDPPSGSLAPRASDPTEVQQNFFKAFQLWLLRDSFAKRAIEEFFTLWCHSGGQHSTLSGVIGETSLYNNVGIVKAKSSNSSPDARRKLSRAPEVGVHRRPLTGFAAPHNGSGNEAKRSSVELRSLAGFFCGV